MIILKNKVELIIPKTDNKGIPYSIMIKALLSTSIDNFSLSDLKGYWVENGITYIDDNFKVEIFTEDTTDTLKKLKKIITFMFEDMEQLAVAVVVNGVMYILENENDYRGLLK